MELHQHCNTEEGIPQALIISVRDFYVIAHCFAHGLLWFIIFPKWERCYKESDLEISSNWAMKKSDITKEWKQLMYPISFTDRKTSYKKIHVMDCEVRKERITLISIQPGEGLMYV